MLLEKEPKESCTEVLPENIDLFFVPGVCFDIEGNRIGMSGGFYDRYLQKCTHAQKIGVAFSCQKHNKLIETNSWDIPMNTVLFTNKIL